MGQEDHRGCGMKADVVSMRLERGLGKWGTWGLGEGTGRTSHDPLPQDRKALHGTSRQWAMGCLMSGQSETLSTYHGCSTSLHAWLFRCARRGTCFGNLLNI